MTDFESMEVGETRPFTTRTVWEGEAQQEYQKAQEYTVKTGALFSIDAVHNAAGKLAGFTITRTR